ncbi:hypothetical protein HDU76_006656, partial [Blyttiomyces sp. JEL0837]
DDLVKKINKGHEKLATLPDSTETSLQARYPDTNIASSLFVAQCAKGYEFGMDMSTATGHINVAKTSSICQAAKVPYVTVEHDDLSGVDAGFAKVDKELEKFDLPRKIVINVAAEVNHVCSGLIPHAFNDRGLPNSGDSMDMTEASPTSSHILLEPTTTLDGSPEPMICGPVQSTAQRPMICGPAQSTAQRPMICGPVQVASPLNLLITPPPTQPGTRPGLPLPPVQPPPAPPFPPAIPPPPGPPAPPPGPPVVVCKYELGADDEAVIGLDDAKIRESSELNDFLQCVLVKALTVIFGKLPGVVRLLGAHAAKLYGYPGPLSTIIKPGDKMDQIIGFNNKVAQCFPDGPGTHFSAHNHDGFYMRKLDLPHYTTATGQLAPPTPVKPEYSANERKVMAHFIASNFRNNALLEYLGTVCHITGLKKNVYPALIWGMRHYHYAAHWCNLDMSSAEITQISMTNNQIMIYKPKLNKVSIGVAPPIQQSSTSKSNTTELIKSNCSKVSPSGNAVTSLNCLCGMTPPHARRTNRVCLFRKETDNGVAKFVHPLYHSWVKPELDYFKGSTSDLQDPTSVLKDTETTNDATIEKLSLEERARVNSVMVVMVQSRFDEIKRLKEYTALLDPEGERMKAYQREAARQNSLYLEREKLKKEKKRKLEDDDGCENDTRLELVPDGGLVQKSTKKNSSKIIRSIKTTVVNFLGGDFDSCPWLYDCVYRYLATWDWVPFTVDEFLNYYISVRLSENEEPPTIRNLDTHAFHIVLSDSATEYEDDDVLFKSWTDFSNAVLTSEVREELSKSDVQIGVLPPYHYNIKEHMITEKVTCFITKMATNIPTLIKKILFHEIKKKANDLNLTISESLFILKEDGLDDGADNDDDKDDTYTSAYKKPSDVVWRRIDSISVNNDQIPEQHCPSFEAVLLKKLLLVKSIGSSYHSAKLILRVMVPNAINNAFSPTRTDNVAVDDSLPNSEPTPQQVCGSNCDQVAQTLTLPEKHKNFLVNAFKEAIRKAIKKETHIDIHQVQIQIEGKRLSFFQEHFSNGLERLNGKLRDTVNQIREGVFQPDSITTIRGPNRLPALLPMSSYSCNSIKLDVTTVFAMMNHKKLLDTDDWRNFFLNNAPASDFTPNPQSKLSVGWMRKIATDNPAKFFAKVFPCARELLPEKVK